MNLASQKHLPGGFNLKELRASSKLPLNLVEFHMYSTLPSTFGQTSLALPVTLHKEPSLAWIEKGF